MAATIYTSIQAVTQGTKRIAYERLHSFLLHLEAYGVNLMSLTVLPDNRISVTLTGPIPSSELPHLGITLG